MSNQVQSLWPADIRPGILPPRSILRGQAEALAMQTDGILQAEVGSEGTRLSAKVILTFDLVVPALHGYRQNILKVAHSKDLPYPAVVDAEIFRYEQMDNISLASFLKTGSVDVEDIDSESGLRPASNCAARDHEFT